MTLPALLAWVGLIPIMIGNGIARESLVAPHVSELSAHQISTLTGVLLLVGYLWLVHPWLGIETEADAWRVGVMWVVLTVGFEFLFGHFVAGHSWARLLRDYNLLEGRMWALLLAATAVAPWLVHRVRG